jgi:hypothetical protein
VRNARGEEHFADGYILGRHLHEAVGRAGGDRDGAGGGWRLNVLKAGAQMGPGGGGRGGGGGGGVEAASGDSDDGSKCRGDSGHVGWLCRCGASNVVLAWRLTVKP